jgi:hypothetical protein
MKLILKKGVTSQTALIFVQDSSKTDGSGLTGLVWNTANLVWYYYREAQGTGATQVTLATMTLGTWATGGFVVVDATNMPGVYEIGIPNAALATGADFVTMVLRGATNMAPVTLEIELVNVDLADSVRMGLTGIPNAVADGPGGLIVSDAGGLDMDAMAGNIIEVLEDTGTTLPVQIGTPEQDGAAASAAGDLQTHGDSEWATATGFATPSSKMALTDETEAQIDAIEAGVDTLGIGTGVHIANVLIEDEDSHGPLPDASILVFSDAARSTRVAYAQANASGVAQIRLDAETQYWYNTKCAEYTEKAGTFTTGLSAASPEDFAVEMVATTAPDAPADPATLLVYEYVRDDAGVLITGDYEEGEGAKLYVKRYKEPIWVDSNMIHPKTTRECENDSNGLVQIICVREGEYELRIVTAKRTRKYSGIIPSSEDYTDGTITLKQLVDSFDWESKDLADSDLS